MTEPGNSIGALQASEARWAAMLEAALDAIIAMDADGRVVEWNAAAETTFGYSRDEAVGEVMGDLIVPSELRESHHKGLARYLETGEARIMGRRLELPAIRKDGTEFPVELTITQVGLAGPPMFMGHVRDITERRSSANLLERRIAQQEAVAILGREAIGATGLEATAERAAALSTDGLNAAAVRVYRLADDRVERLASAGVEAPELEAVFSGIGQRAIDSGQTVGETLRPPGRDEEHLIAAAIVGADGPIGAVAVCVPATNYAPGDESFVESIANVLAATSDRNQVFAELQTSRDQLDVIFRNVAEAITVQDGDGRLLYANDAAARLVGLNRAEELMSTPVGELMAKFAVMDTDRQPLPVEDLPGRRTLATGMPHESIIVYRILATGEEKWSRVRSSPVRDERGDVLFAINIVRDITEEHREEREARLLARVGEVLGRSLDYEQTLSDLADLVVPEFADWCTVDMVEPDRTLGAVAIAHTDPARIALVRRLRASQRFTLDSDIPLAHVVRTGDHALLPEIPDELLERAIPDPDQLAAIRELEFRSSLIVPLPARGRVLGAIAMAMAESGRSFEPSDVRLLQEVARRAAVAIDNARLYSERNYIAETLQRSLLPPYLPEIDGLELAATYRASGAGNEVGGDFYDVFRFDERRWAFVVGDVQGKGVEAASLVGVARHTLRAAALSASKPQRVLRLLNKALLTHPTDRLCTAVLVLVERDGDRATAQVAVAGHAPPIVRRSGSADLVPARGTVLGCFDEIDVETATVELGAGDALVLFSDGAVGRGQSLIETMQGYVAAVDADGAAALAEQVGRRIAADQRDGLQDDLTLLIAAVSSGLTPAAPPT